ncbi:MAG: KH domain-containing protein [Leptonema illini]|mgnify:CR=1 FL=1|jgi:spoIIIJ-associated protein|uniref:RNA-binding protein KhpB n=2 Tax=Leptonema illini TaxID=183 RepID=H2CGM1_9LEPT|nr:RNA-binding cell elongation regulator Jag/EloR [Leptonema illini]EHQ07938.1 single-stranded nucleic acid binding R3H domain-containing protein [Leptonema illini DSM 21528]KAB2935352.1 MAG: KH domain-containing protein [Leptonema illini]PKL34157.1 MAG: KH domain-containing protein [Spirochaetae bacterium HGW-Spirochaetae-10]
MNFVYETDGKTKGDAIRKAMDVLGVGEDDATFITEGASLLGLVSRKPVTVRVKNDKKKLSDNALIRGVTLTVIARLGVEAEIETIEETDENYVAHVNSEDSGFLIGRQGRTLDAIQFLVNLLLNKELKKKKRVLVDVARYRERRKDYLKKLARNIAGRVMKNGKSFLLEAMNPYERRIIHLELEGDAKITTESEGNGLYKRVRVMRIDENPGNRKRRGGNGNRSQDYDEDDDNIGNRIDD